jgi:soluble lytic murein transglycosylase
MRKRAMLYFNLGIILLLAIGIYLAVPVIFGSVVAPLPEEYKGVITKYAQQYNIDSCFIAAVIRGESNWNPNAGSHAGAQGLMQLIPSTAASMAKREGRTDYTRNKIRDPDINVQLGTAYLRYNVDAYGSLRNVLVAYNAGGGRVRLPDSQLPRETQFYIGKISRYYNLYSSLYPDFCTGPTIQGGPGLAASGGGGSATVDFPDFIPPPNTGNNVDINTFWKSFLTQQ